MQLTKSNKYAHDSFITDKKMNNTDETIISIRLAKSNNYADDSFITDKKLLILYENSRN